MVDLVIVNWNSGELLRDCINSIINSPNELLISNIFIIDNNSSDNSIDILPPGDKLNITRNKENLGFAKACNQGFHLSASPFVLLLNPDTRLHSNTLDRCKEFMEANQHIGILGCQLLDDNGAVTESCARFPTPLRMCFDAIGLSKIAPSIFTPSSLMTDWDHKESRFVDQVMGAFMFMRKSVFRKAGYFDERFFVYYEELDFSERLSKAGGKSYFNAEITAVHTGCGTTESVKGFRLFLNLRSKLQYAKKHFNGPGYAIVWFSTLIIEPVTRSLLLLIKGRVKEIPDIFKGYKLLFKALPIK